MATLVALPVCMVMACSSPPKLTPEQRRQDIEFLAHWARDCSPFVRLNEAHKDTPGCEALKARYLAFAEQAQGNEEFFLVVSGYFTVIGASGHAQLVQEDFLETVALGEWLGIGDWGVSPRQMSQAKYWPKLADSISTRAHPPFRVEVREGGYWTGDDWQHDGGTVPRGSRIVQIDGMSCSSYLSYVKEHTHLRYDAYPKDWVDKYLLVIDEGPAHRGWQVEFVLPDGAAARAFVPKLKGFAPEPGKRVTIDAKDNCTCLQLTNDVGYVRIKSMWHGPLSIVFNSYIQEERWTIRSFLERAQGKYTKLIIDVRNNGGGDPAYVYDILISPFLDRPVTFTQAAGIRRKYLENTSPSVLRMLRKYVSQKVVATREMEPPAGFDPREWVFYEITRRVVPANRYPFYGKLYVLTNRGTFSAGDDYADVVKRTRIGTLVGQNTGGGAAGYLLPPLIRLPASGMVFRIEADLLLTPEGGFDELFGTEPDVKLPTTRMPESITREELLKDEWIRKVIDDL